MKKTLLMKLFQAFLFKIGCIWPKRELAGCWHLFVVVWCHKLGCRQWPGGWYRAVVTFYILIQNLGVGTSVRPLTVLDRSQENGQIACSGRWWFELLNRSLGQGQVEFIVASFLFTWIGVTGFRRLGSAYYAISHQLSASTLLSFWTKAKQWQNHNKHLQPIFR